MIVYDPYGELKKVVDEIKRLAKEKPKPGKGEDHG